RTLFRVVGLRHSLRRRLWFEFKRASGRRGRRRNFAFVTRISGFKLNESPEVFGVGLWIMHGHGRPSLTFSKGGNAMPIAIDGGRVDRFVPKAGYTHTRYDHLL